MKNHQFYSLAILLLLIFSACQPKLTKQKMVKKNFQENVKTNSGVFLETAVATGMENEGFPKDLAKAMRNNRQLWIGKCPICDAVQRGINRYVNSSASISVAVSTEKQLLDDLKTNEKETQKLALKKMIDNYVSEHYKRLGMSESEISTMKSKLEADRKRGMRGVGDNKFCASCDGACDMP
jgi:predicted DsbA family dithiol-disulfide isomerase